MNYWPFLIPVLSTVVGWLISLLAGKILVYRILPKRRQSLANEIGKAASNALNFSVVEKKISDPETVKKIMPVVEKHVDDFLRYKLKEKMPVIGMFIGDKTIGSLKEVFLKEIEDLFPEVLKHFAGDLRNELNIEEMVANKITAVRSAQIEKKIAPALRYFYVTGAINGLVIGIINVIIFFILK